MRGVRLFCAVDQFAQNNLIHLSSCVYITIVLVEKPTIVLVLENVFYIMRVLMENLCKKIVNFCHCVYVTNKYMALF